MKHSAVILACIIIFFSASVSAEPVVFEDAGMQQRFQSLIEEIRCLVCQNQSLSDSNAELAQDLRNEVFRMLHAGSTDQEIIDFLVTRYGDFVLYRPPLKTTTYILWFGPFILFLVALIVIYRVVKSGRVEQISVSDEQQVRISQLLANKDNE